MEGNRHHQAIPFELSGWKTRTCNWSQGGKSTMGLVILVLEKMGLVMHKLTEACDAGVHFSSE